MPREPIYAGGDLIGWSDELGIDASVEISDSAHRRGMASGSNDGVGVAKNTVTPESQKTGGSRRREEANLQDAIIDLLHLHGWFVAHFRPGMTGRTYLDKNGVEKNVWVTAVAGDGAGFPDLIAVHGGSGHILVIEVKSNTGKLSQNQQHWRSLWEASPATYFLARPNNWDELVALVKEH